MGSSVAIKLNKKRRCQSLSVVERQAMKGERVNIHESFRSLLLELDTDMIESQHVRTPYDISSEYRPNAPIAQGS
jgi:hypothetical protein